MRASRNDKKLCEEARPYYYELLCHDDAAVPEAIVRHVEGCSFCREQIRRLKDTYFPADEPVPASSYASDGATIEALDRHFGFLGESVRCSHVKPFLPELLPWGPEIRVPTPITVHIENCPQCTDDLASLRSLGLTAGQLRRLGQFYDESSRYHPSICDPAQSTAAALAGFGLDETDPESLEHVSRCPECRQWVYRQRAQIASDLRAQPVQDGVLLCREIAASDLFDFVLPFGLDDGALARADGRRDAVITHVRACPDCLERVQTLHRTIYAIAERADSALCTIYRCQDDGEPALQRYPVNVQILHDEPTATTHCGELSPQYTPPGRGNSAVARRKFPVRATLSAVALLFVASLVVSTQMARGTNVDDLVKSLEGADNVYMATWDERNPQRPIHEMWVARDAGVVARRLAYGTTVYYPDKGQKILIDPSGTVNRRPLPRKEADRCAGFMGDSIRDLFAAARAENAFSPAMEEVPGHQDGPPVVFELTREGHGSAGQMVSHRWKITLDSAGQLPRRIDYWSSDGSALPGRQPARTTTFEYPSTAEIESRIKALRQPE